MRVRKKEKITSTHTKEVVIFSTVFGALATAAFGPIGILVGVVGFAAGYPVAKRQSKEEADELIQHDQISDAELRRAVRNGKNEIVVKTKLKNIYPDQPILGRIFIGNKLTKKTTYYLED
jgi:hypothetical protein